MKDSTTLRETYMIFSSNNEELRKNINVLAYGHLSGTERKYDLDCIDVLADARTPYNWGWRNPLKLGFSWPILY